MFADKDQEVDVRAEHGDHLDHLDNLATAERDTETDGDEAVDGSEEERVMSIITGVNNKSLDHTNR